MAIWPATLPLPQVDGYGGEPIQAFVRTDMEAGPARQRKRFTAAPHMRNVAWRFTAAEMATFKSFYDNDLNRGADWFSITLDVGAGLATYDARFTAPYKDAARAGMNWTVTASIEVRA